ncbi:MAG: hypothetical protein ABI378_07980 [Chitinophagaceae bacterium]
MDNETNDELPEEFDGTEEERLQMEIEMLKLKLKAELGAELGSVEGMEKLPLEVERQFLEQLLSFHHHMDNAPEITVREHLGNPVFESAENLSEAALEAAFIKVSELYESKFLRVDFQAEYPARLRYEYLTKELIDEKIETPPPNSYLCITYEEGHPNPDYDQRRLTQNFFEHFFANNFDGIDLEEPLVSPDKEIFSHEEATEMLHRFHGIFEDIKEWTYEITEIASPTALEPYNEETVYGQVSGIVSYTIQQDGAEQEISGPFKLYNQCSGGWWESLYFEVHGFSWKRS